MKQKLIIVALIVIALCNLFLISCGKKEDMSMQKDNKVAQMEYLGHGSLKLFLSDGKVCYIDPYAGDDYKEPADLILITHEHGDHNNIDLVKQNTGCKIYRSADMLKNGNYQKINACGMEILAVEAYNKNHKKEECVGYFLTIGDKKVYVAGDTSTTNQMKEIGNMNIDYAFLPMDGVYNMDISEAIECEKLIKAKHTIPYHIAPGELFDEDRAKAFETQSTMIIRPNEKFALK